MSYYTMSVASNSDISFKMTYNECEYYVSKEPITITFDSTKVIVEIQEVPDSFKYTVLNVITFIIGLLITPILNALFFHFPKFSDGLTPLLLNGKYILEFSSTQKEVIFSICESAFDGSQVMYPSINVKTGKLIPIKETHLINFIDIKHSIFCCKYNICSWIFTGTIISILLFLGVEDLALRCLVLIFLLPFLVISWITNFIFIKKQKNNLFNCFSQMNCTEKK